MVCIQPGIVSPPSHSSCEEKLENVVIAALTSEVFSLVQFCLEEDFYFCQECLSVCYVKPCRDDACQTDESLV